MWKTFGGFIMNGFIVGENQYGQPCPYESAKAMCDSHIPKMTCESIQIVVQAALSAGVPPELMPLTKTTGKPHRGGYKHHPVVVWAGESLSNWIWMLFHADALCGQFLIRYGKEHFGRSQVDALFKAFTWEDYLPNLPMTPFARCFNQSKGMNLDLLDESKYSIVEAYRLFYKRDKFSFAKWDRGVPAPSWWDEMEVIA
jgi:hypothetical protein